MKYTLIYLTLLSLVLFTHCQDDEQGSTVALTIFENGVSIDQDWTSYLQNLGLTSEDVSGYSECLLDPACGGEYSYLADDGCAYIRGRNDINNVWEVWTVCYSTGEDPVVSLKVLSNLNDQFIDIDWGTYLEGLGLSPDDVSYFSGCAYESTCTQEFSYLADDGCAYIRNQNEINDAIEVWSIC